MSVLRGLLASPCKPVEPELLVRLPAQRVAVLRLLLAGSLDGSRAERGRRTRLARADRTGPRRGHDRRTGVCRTARVAGPTRRPCRPPGGLGPRWRAAVDAELAGFEHADTSVSAAICLYGYYGHYHDGDSPAAASSPAAYTHAGARPFFLAHGDRDTILIVDDARGSAERLRAASPNPVVYAELPGGQHTFDLFESLRFASVIDGVEVFTAHVRSHDAAPTKPRHEAAGLRGAEDLKTAGRESRDTSPQPPWTTTGSTPRCLPLHGMS
jgi:hypothetical protein